MIMFIEEVKSKKYYLEVRNESECGKEAHERCTNKGNIFPNIPTFPTDLVISDVRHVPRYFVE